MTEKKNLTIDKILFSVTLEADVIWKSEKTNYIYFLLRLLELYLSLRLDY
jgi:hypothetical protein